LRPQIHQTLARVRTEHIATQVERRLRVIRELQVTEVSRLLTQRARRIVEGPENFDLRPPMALRSETPPVMRAASAPQPTMRDWDNAEKLTGVEIKPPAMSLGGIDVERLTSEVMKQIDRKVIARRERLGQI
jgi:hypothetical protein